MSAFAGPVPAPGRRRAALILSTRLEEDWSSPVAEVSLTLWVLAKRVDGAHWHRSRALSRNAGHARDGQVEGLEHR